MCRGVLAGPLLFFVCLLVFKKMGILCRLGWPHACYLAEAGPNILSFCFLLLSVGISSVNYHAQLFYTFFILSLGSVCVCVCMLQILTGNAQPHQTRMIRNSGVVQQGTLVLNHLQVTIVCRLSAQGSPGKHLLPDSSHRDIQFLLEEPR